MRASSRNDWIGKFALEKRLRTLTKGPDSSYVDDEVVEVEKMPPPEPTPKVLFEDIYVQRE